MVRLDDHGEREPEATLGDVLEVADRDEHAARGVDPGAADHQLGHPFVERDRVRVGVRAGERDAELLEQARIERLAHPPGLTLGGVEDDVRIDRLETLEEVGRGTGDLDLFDLVTGGLDRCGDRAHRLGAVVLGLFFGLPDIGQPKIVRERDLHGVITT